MDKLSAAFLFIFLFIWVGIAGCTKKYSHELVVLQSFYFNKGQSYQLDIDSGAFTKEKRFREVYITDEYKSIGIFKTNEDSIHIRFTLDQSDTAFTIPSNYSKRMVIGSNAYGEMLIGFDRDSSFWESQ